MKPLIPCFLTNISEVDCLAGVGFVLLACSMLGSRMEREREGERVREREGGREREREGEKETEREREREREGERVR